MRNVLAFTFKSIVFSVISLRALAGKIIGNEVNYISIVTTTLCVGENYCKSSGREISMNQTYISKYSTALFFLPDLCLFKYFCVYFCVEMHSADIILSAQSRPNCAFSPHDKAVHRMCSFNAEDA